VLSFKRGGKQQVILVILTLEQSSESFYITTYIINAMSGIKVYDSRYREPLFGGKRYGAFTIVLHWQFL